MSNDFSDSVVSINFTTVKPEDAKIAVFDRGFLYGDSVYETMRTYEGKLFTFSEHYERLARSAAGVYFELPFSKEQLKGHLKELIGKVAQPNCYLRIIVTRGQSALGLDPPKELRPLTVIIARPMHPWLPHLYSEGIRLCTSNVRRNLPSAIDPKIKSGNYLNNVIAINRAKHDDFDDAVMLNVDGNISECTSANIFFVKDGELITPPVEAGILDGISRNIVMKMAREKSISVSTPNITPAQAHDADEAFISSSTREIMPVAQLDEKRFAVPGPITKNIMALYRHYTETNLD